MARSREISSNARLLKIIRGKKSSPGIQMPRRGWFEGKWRFLRFFAFWWQRPETVGVDIGVHALRLVRVQKGADGKATLTRYLTIPLESEIPEDSPEFVLFLKAVLSDFKISRKTRLWSAISAARAEIRYIQVPICPPHQLAKVVYWSYRKEVEIDETETIFNFEVLGRIRQNGADKLEVMVCTAPRAEVEALKERFARAGFTLSGVLIHPFALQNLFRKQGVGQERKNLCTLYIGENWSRIDVFESGGTLLVSRRINASLRSLKEGLAQNTPQLPDDQRRLLFSAFLRGQIESAARVIDRELTEKDLFEMLRPALDRLIRQVERTLDYYYTHISKETISKLYVFGAAVTVQRITDYINAELKSPQVSWDMDPFAPTPRLAVEAEPPESQNERFAFAPAVGMALAEGRITPNFLKTFEDRQEAIRLRRTHRLLGVMVGILLILCMAGGKLQKKWITARASELEKVESELNSFVTQAMAAIQDETRGQASETVKLMLHRTLVVNSGPVTPADIRALIRKKKEMIALKKRYIRRYFPLALFRELSVRTPSVVRLSGLTLSQENKPPRLSLEGFVGGNRLDMEGNLMGFMEALRGSPLFEKPVVAKKSMVKTEAGEQLNFTGQVDIRMPLADNETDPDSDIQ